MLSVIIECKDQEAAIAQSLASLVSGAVQGLVADVILLDHGSTDGTAALADAVGCRFAENSSLSEVLQAARGEWIMVIEPGARIMQGSWNEEIPEYIGLALGPASFRASSHYQKPFWQRLFARKNPLELGLLMSKADVMRGAANGLSLSEIAASAKKRKLTAQLIPAWVLSSSAAL